MHLAVTWRSDGEMVGYINGAPVISQAVSGSLGVSDAPLVITPNGVVDDVRVYGRTLSQGQVNVLAGGRSCISTATGWADAMSDLQCVLLDTVAGNNVWVANGLYTPTRGQARTATFTLGDGVAVYGGFAGGETELSQRAPSVNRVVLSGDIERNDQVAASGSAFGVKSVVGANAYHVVTISNGGATTTLDGFTVTGGQADGALTPDCGPACGGGIVSKGGGPILRNLIVAGNRAGGNGGGIWSSLSGPVLVGVAVLGNEANNGGGLYCEGSAPVMVNSLIAGNLALAEGGGVYADRASLRMVNVSVASNKALARGGGLLLANGGQTLANSVVGGNAALDQPRIATNGVEILRSLLEAGCPDNGACVDIVVAPPLFVDPLPTAAVPASSGDYRLQPASLAIDAGTNDASLGDRVPDGPTITAISRDLGNSPRLIAVRGLPATIDAGAYEMPNSPPFFTSAPVTLGTTTMPYSYTATASDPNDPLGVSLAFSVITRPTWLEFASGQPGSIVAAGAPGPEDQGGFPVGLRVTDPVGAMAEQAFEITVAERIYTLYMPKLSKN